MNSVVAGNDLQNVNVNLTQTWNFGGVCKSGPDGKPLPNCTTVGPAPSGKPGDPGYCARGSDCNGHGVCQNNTCVCSPDWGGELCSIPPVGKVIADWFKQNARTIAYASAGVVAVAIVMLIVMLVTGGGVMPARSVKFISKRIIKK